MQLGRGMTVEVIMIRRIRSIDPYRRRTAYAVRFPLRSSVPEMLSAVFVVAHVCLLSSTLTAEKETVAR